MMTKGINEMIITRLRWYENCCNCIYWWFAHYCHMIMLLPLEKMEKKEGRRPDNYRPTVCLKSPPPPGAACCSLPWWFTNIPWSKMDHGEGTITASPGQILAQDNVPARRSGQGCWDKLPWSASWVTLDCGEELLWTNYKQNNNTIFLNNQNLTRLTHTNTNSKI